MTVNFNKDMSTLIRPWVEKIFFMPERGFSLLNLGISGSKEREIPTWAMETAMAKNIRPMANGARILISTPMISWKSRLTPACERSISCRWLNDQVMTSAIEPRILLPRK